MFLKKMLRDIRASKAQFISIFILAFLGVFVYSGMRAQWEGMRNEVDIFYADTRLADIFVIGEDLDESSLTAVRSKSFVTDAQLRLELDMEAIVGEGATDSAEADAGDDTSAATSSNKDKKPALRILISDDNLLSMPLVVEGAAYDPTFKGIWLDQSFANEHGLSVGDTLASSFSGLKLELPIQGFILHPEFVHNVRDNNQIATDPTLFGYACVPSASVEWPMALPYNHILVRVSPEAGEDDINALIEELESIPGVFHVMLREDHPSVSMFDAEILQNQSMATLFPIIFFFVAALSMLTTMTRLVLAQRTLIGTFMGMGFSRRKILFHYMSYGLWIGLIGGLLGLALGPWFISELLYSFQRLFYTLPVWRPAFSMYSVLSVVGSTAVCVLSCYIACAKELRETPAEALRPKSPKLSKHTSLEKTRLWHRLSFSSKWNIRDILRSRVRSLMAIVGVAGCMMMLVWGIGLYDSMNRSMTVYFDHLLLFDNKAYVEPGFKPEEINGTAGFQAVDERAVSIRSGDTRDVYSLRIMDEGNLIRFEDADGRELDLPEEGILISGKTARKLGLSVGDSVTFRLLGADRDYTVTIADIHRSPFDQGLVISRVEFEGLGLTMTPTVYLLGKGSSVSPDTEGVVEVQDKSSLSKSFGQLLEGTYVIIFVLFLAAVLLGCVVLYNLGSLSFAERIRELATLRVLGYPLPLIRKLLRLQTVILTTLGIIIGIPLGYFFVNLVMQTMSDSIDFPSYVEPVSLIACVAGTFLVSLGVDLFLSTKTKHIDMVSALKSIE